MQNEFGEKGGGGIGVGGIFIISYITVIVIVSTLAHAMKTNTANAFDFQQSMR